MKFVVVSTPRFNYTTLYREDDRGRLVRQEAMRLLTFSAMFMKGKCCRIVAREIERDQR
jgi:hypothetical protein